MAIFAAMLAAGVGLAPLCQADAQQPRDSTTLDASSLRYTVVPDALQVPSNANFGEVAAVALDARQNLYVFNRGGKPLMKFDKRGRYIGQLAQGLITHAHSVRVDRHGYIWLVDDADHDVIQLDARGNVRMVFGRRGLSGDTDDLFNRPTDVAVNSRGEIYVADGYGNSRVVKFSPEGKFLLKWGTKGAGPGQFDIPHAIVIDALDHVYVADRENHRIQVFDKDGRFITQWGNFELPQGLYLAGGRSLFVGDRTRVVELDLSGRVLGILGSRGKRPGQFMGLHGLAVAPDGTLYTAELINWRVQKFIPALGARGR
jgi:DNA-binding beta-propeller fold protein YncE